jgi:hypothetical protein
MIGEPLDLELRFKVTMIKPIPPKDGGGKPQVLFSHVISQDCRAADEFPNSIGELKC